MSVKPTSLLRLVLILYLCLSASLGHAARWEDHRTAALRAVDQVDYAKAVEQFEAAIYFAQELPASDRDIADLWENLTATYLADEQYDRAWDSIAQWDKVLAANAGQDWVAEQQTFRDEITRILFEEARTERSDGAAKPAEGYAKDGAVVSAEPPSLALAPAAGAPASAPEPAEGPATKAPQTAEAPPAAPPAAQPGRYGVHLASYRNEANARTGWAELQAAFPDALSGKTFALRRVDLGDKGIFVRLIAVPFADIASARAACADLRRHGQYCAAMQLN